MNTGNFDKSTEIAWNFLTDLEKNSLYLQLSKGQSSWETGEILGISHYKYLELRERSATLLKLFSEFFRSYPSLVSPESVIEDKFRDYLDGVIEKRLSKKESLRLSGDSSMSVNSINSKVISRNMLRLVESESNWDNDLYKLILEFDRWNNFRILPRDIQLPSPYKRRNNKRVILYIKYITSIPDWKILNIINKFQYNPKKLEKKSYWVVFFSKTLSEDGYTILRIKRNEINLKAMSKLRCYVFEEERLADAFGYTVSMYNDKVKRPKAGLIFWNEYRELVSMSCNELSLNNQDFYKKSLNMAYSIPMNTSKKSKAKKATGTKRVDPEIFK